MSADIGVDSAEDAYDALADHYDLFTAEHDHDDWMGTVERLAQRHGLSGHRLLDLACGTGKSLAPLVRRGFAAVGCDVSARMIEHARTRLGQTAALTVCDIRDLPHLGLFDLVTCMDDAVNYLMSNHDLVAAFRGVRDNLAPGGVVVFDANTIHAYRTAFTALRVVAGEDRAVVYEGRPPEAPADGALVQAVFELYTRAADGTWERRHSIHRQRHHPEHAIVAALAQAGLVVAGTYGMSWDGSVEDGIDQQRHSKALYIARSAP